MRSNGHGKRGKYAQRGQVGNREHNGDDDQCEGRLDEGRKQDRHWGKKSVGLKRLLESVAVL